MLIFGITRAHALLLYLGKGLNHFLLQCGETRTPILVVLKLGCRLESGGKCFKIPTPRQQARPVVLESLECRIWASGVLSSQVVSVGSLMEDCPRALSPRPSPGAGSAGKVRVLLAVLPEQESPCESRRPQVSLQMCHLLPGFSQINL